MSPSNPPTYDFTEDLDDCDREPLHVPGASQSFARVLVIDPEKQQVTHASSGPRTTDPTQVPAQLRPALAELLADPSPRPRTLWTGPLQGKPRTATGHVHQGRAFLVIEDAESETPALDQVHRCIQQLEAAESLADLLHTLVTDLRILTGFDRVMAYGFDRDGTGTVIAEDAAAHLESFVGLRYPATDIPRQARRLFVTERVRVIADVDAVPQPLLPTDQADDGPVDLTHVISRAVSPIHLTYLRNMGVRASMSIALVDYSTGDLWGLIACHHYEGPRVLGLESRLLLSMVSSSASLAIQALQRRLFLADDARHSEAHLRINQALAEHFELLDGARACEADLVGLFDAEGFAVVTQDTVHSVGSVPTPATIRAIASQSADGDCEVFTTDRWPAPVDETHFPGVLAIVFANTPDAMLLWFREEETQRVRWGGNPDKVADATGQLTPRNSFREYIESVRGRARPWTELERHRARRLCVALRDVLYRERARAAVLRAELVERRADLQSFANLASHDLREPIRAIGNYATFLREDAGDRLDRETLGHLDAIDRLVQRTYSLIRGMLAMSRLGQLPVTFERVDLTELLEEVRRDLDERLRATGGTIEAGPLPTVHSWHFGLHTIFVNLLVNGLKYSDKPPRIRVELRDAGSIASRPAAVDDQAVVIAFQDDGIGIDPQNLRVIFRMFHRLHPNDAYEEGTGAGLAIVRRVTERLDGNVWVDSTPGSGSVFYIHIPGEAVT